MARSTTAQKIVTDSLSTRIAVTETSISQVSQALSDNTDAILLLSNEVQDQENIDINIQTTLNAITTALARLDRQSKLQTRDLADEEKLLLTPTDFGFQSFSIPAFGTASVNLANISDSYSRFAIINSESSGGKLNIVTGSTTLASNLDPGETWEGILNTAGQWVEI